MSLSPDDGISQAAIGGEAGAWQQALAAAASLHQATGALGDKPDETLTLLAGGLRDTGEQHRALLLLGYLDPRYAVALADILVDVARNRGDSLLVSQIFGRLSRDQAQSAVPAAVWRLLARGEDVVAYRRMAELLYHLGLTAALHRLCVHALASEDPGMQDVGADFAPDQELTELG
jgi:hypothetical protein